jgi:hypothetical protein
MEKNLENASEKQTHQRDTSERRRETRERRAPFPDREEETNEALRESRTTVNSLS